MCQGLYEVLKSGFFGTKGRVIKNSCYLFAFLALKCGDKRST